MMSDVRLRQQGSGEDFVDLYDRSVGEVWSYVYSRLRDRALAEDLTQDVFLEGARRAASGATVELPWLIAVARNKLIDHWRATERRERRLRLLHGGGGGGEPVGADGPMDVDGGRAADVLDSLNPIYRAALVLRHVDGLSVPEVAAHLDRTVAATEQVLSRARAAFRHEYGGSPRD